MSNPTHDPELTAVEQALAGLAPTVGQLNRDALMFAAGRGSVRRGWTWPIAAMGSTLAALALAAVLLFHPTPEPVERIVYRDAAPKIEKIDPRPDPAPSAEEAPSSGPQRPEPDYLTVRNQVVRWGDAGLPSAPPAADDKPAKREDLLDLPADVRADPWIQRRSAMLHPGGSL